MAEMVQPCESVTVAGAELCFGYFMGNVERWESEVLQELQEV